MLQEFELGDIIKMKKKHACGTNKWLIIRVGADIKIKCIECNRIVMLEREAFVKGATKKLDKIIY